MKRITRLEAIRHIIEAHDRRPTKSDATAVRRYRRAYYAAGALGLTVGEISELMYFLEYHEKDGRRCAYLDGCIQRLNAAKAAP